MKKKFFLPFILLIAFLLRLPSLFEPNWYGDEGIYQVIGKAMAAGLPLYTGIWDNKPPLLYMIYMIFNGEQFGVRAFSFLFMIVSIITFYVVSQKLFKQQRSTYIATSIFSILFALPLLEGNIANAENFMIFPTLLSLLLILTSINTKSKALFPYFFAGLLIGLAFLIKIVAIFDLATVFIFLFFLFFLKDTKKWFTQSVLVGTGFVIPFALTIIYFWATNGLGDFFTAAFSQNVSYVGAGNKFLIGQGLLLIKLALLTLFCLGLFIKRKVLPKEYILIYLWFAFSLFNAFFGGRPWTHYLLTLLPAFSLLLGLISDNKALRTFTITLCLLTLFLAYKNFWIYGKTLGYYKNFAQFALKSENTYTYRGFFDWFVNRDYDIAAYIAQHSTKGETLFIWGDNAQIYALSDRLPPGRYTVAYHVTYYATAFTETKKAIDTKKPVFIVAMRDDFPMELLGESYTLVQIIDNVKIYARRT